MKKRKIESIENLNPNNSLKDFEFYCNYNKKVRKNKFKNSLTPSEIIYFDNLLETPIPKEAQIAQKAYSKKSDIFNNFYRLSKEEFKRLTRVMK